VKQSEVESLIEQLAEQLHGHLEASGIQAPIMIGIHTGGAWVAQRLHQLLRLPDPLGTLDISFYRDDFTRIGMNPKVRPSEMPFSVENRHVILVDDVLQSGRTVRAAMNEIFDSANPSIYEIKSKAPGPTGQLPLTAEMLRTRPSGDIFGWTQDAGMGWDPAKLGGKEVLILSTQGGIRAPDGTPVALGYHTGHFEVGLLMEAAAWEVRRPHPGDRGSSRSRSSWRSARRVPIRARR
jgi:pyrimidine operon attenuation protein/uracil phosphoribosyltransferase